MESRESSIGQSSSVISVPRPSSLLGPEKEPVNFTVNLVGAPPEVEQLIEHIKSVAQQFLYHWKTFPINLPSPLSGNGSNTNRRYRPINLRDLFISPPFDELDAVAMDGAGEPRRLTNTQLKSIRDRGKFEVPSLNFPGKIHIWKLAKFLQKGYSRARNSLLNDLALALEFIIITAKSRIIDDCFSIAEGAKSLLKGLLRFIDILVGIPSLLAYDLDTKIKEERCRYLVAELVCRPEYEDCLDELCAYVRQQLQRATTEKFDVECESAQPVPYLFLTPNGQEIDLRLFSRDIIRKALPILMSILERETRGWFLHFREKLIAELREKKMTDTEIEEEVNEAVMKEYLQRVYSSILNNTELCALGEGIPQLLVQQAQSVVIMHKAIEKTQKELRKNREEHEKYLMNEYPVRSRIYPWLQSKLQAAETTKMSKSTWAPHEEAIRVCAKHNLQQTSYFLTRDMVFMKEREPVLMKELQNVQAATRNFQWPCRIWSPKSWIIRRNFQGQSEIIPTVICQQATSIVTPRSDPSQPVFLVEKEIIRTTSTRWPFWRLLNLLQRTWCWTWNIMFLLGYIVPWCSSLSLRALFCVKPFMPDLELSQINGTLFPRKTSITQTLVSKLIALWRHISKARTRFETEPDTGFIGKGLTRHLNRIYNYFMKGFLGTMIIVFLFPLVCLSVCAASIILAVAAPIWMPILTVFLHIFMMVIFDFDSPHISKNPYFIIFEIFIWNILIQGLIQPLVAVIVFCAICPLVTVVIFLAAIFRYWLRLLWDSFTFHFFIKKYGRVPANNSFAVKRIAGPGLESDYVFGIKPEQALAAFEAKMELDELQAYQQATESTILQPQKDFRQFVEACFGPYSAQLSKTGPYRSLEREGKDLLASLHEKLEKRRRDLQTGLTHGVKSKIKLNTMELKIAIQQGAHLLEKFYPDHVFGRLAKSEDEFWDSNCLQVGDWAGLAGQLYTEIFSLDFLTPLSDTDIQFRLDPHPQLDLMRYTEMVQNASDTMGVNGPDLLGNVYAPRGNIQINAPYLEISVFNPRSRITMIFKKLEERYGANSKMYTQRSRLNKIKSWRPWKRKHSDKFSPGKLLIPLSIPHPAHIAIAIHNRDSEQPIPLDSTICWDILRAIEDCNEDVEATNIVSRYQDDAPDSNLNSMDSSSNRSQNSSSSDDSIKQAVCKTVTLPCEVITSVTQSQQQESSGFHWTLSNWGATQTARRRNNTGTIRVDLASPEDISLDTDSSRVVFSAYGTTV